MQVKLKAELLGLELCLWVQVILPEGDGDPKWAAPSHQLLEVLTGT